MKKVVILSHNMHRDRMFDIMLSQELNNRMQPTWVRRYLDNDRKAICTIKPHIVILPEIRCEYTRDLAMELKSWGVQVVVKMCEVGITEESLPHIKDDYRRAIFGNWPVNHCADMVLVWGPKTKKLICQYGSYDGSKVHAVGGMAFDQYSHMKPDIPRPKTDKKIVLFATGFAYADRNPEYSVPEALTTDSLHGDIVQADRDGREKWFKMISAFCEKYSDEWHIQIKPHGGEYYTVYHSAFKDKAQVFGDMSGHESLIHPDVVVHAGSTLAYEAHLLNKPAFNYANVCQDVIVSKISPCFDDADEFFKAFDAAELGKSNANPEIIKNLETNYYGPVDGKAYLRSADLVLSLPANRPMVPDMWKPMMETKYPSKEVVPRAMVWPCGGCGNVFYVTNEHREMAKCPFCGIACVKKVVIPSTGAAQT